MLKSLMIRVVLISISPFVCSFVLAADQSKLAQTMYAKHILPGYKDLSLKTIALNKSVSALCDMPSDENYQKVLEDYKSTLLSWSGVEHLRFGPITENYKYERFAYWPDVKGRGLRRVRLLLKKKDESVLSVERLKKKSIAFQGLTALEFLLHGKGKEQLLTSSPEGKYRCSFSKAITVNLKTMSLEVLEGWKAGSKYTNAFLSPSQDKVYKSNREVTLELFQAYVSAYQRVRLIKVLRPLGLPKKVAPNYKLAPYWRSGLTVDVVSANMKALKHMFLVGGFNELVSKSHPDLKESVTLSVDNGLRILKGINGPVFDIVNDESKWKKYKFIGSILGVMRGHTGVAIVKSANLTIGFNADDGD